MAAKDELRPVLKLFQQREVRRGIAVWWKEYRSKSPQDLHDVQHSLDRKLRGFFDDKVVSKLARPPVMDANDLVSMFKKATEEHSENHGDVPHPEGAYERKEQQATELGKTYESFIDAVSLIVSDFYEGDDEYRECSEPIEVYRGQTDGCFDLAALSEEGDDVLWQRPREFEVRLCGVVSNFNQWGDTNQIAFISVDGNCTQSALVTASREAAEAVAIVIRLAESLANIANCMRGPRGELDSLLQEIKDPTAPLNPHYRKKRSDSAKYFEKWKQKNEGEQLGPDPLSKDEPIGIDQSDASRSDIVDSHPHCPREMTARYYLPMLKELLSAYFGDPVSKKKRQGDMPYRLRNAVQLLAHDSAQSSNGIGLALAVTAIETLLCEKGSDSISDKVASRIAALLEPDTTQRSKAKKVAKKLYELRSDVLHGTNIECTPSDREDARSMATAVIYAVSGRRLARCKCGQPEETITEMVDHLDEDILKQVETRYGTEDLLQDIATVLWRKPKWYLAQNADDDAPALE